MPDFAIDIDDPEAVAKIVDQFIEAGLVHSVHVSERRAFRGCRRRWEWSYLDDLTPVTPIQPLEFGIAYHEAMESYYHPETWHLDPTVRAVNAMAIFRDRNDAQLAKYRELNNGFVEDTILENYKAAQELGRGMLSDYFLNTAPALDFFTPVKVEVAFEVPLTDDLDRFVWCTCDRCWQRWVAYNGWEITDAEKAKSYTGTPVWKGLPLTIGGRIDMLGKDEDGRYVIFDWKSAAKMMSEDEEWFLFLDDQISTYMLAMWLLDIPVDTFVYHEQYKRFPSAPEPLSKRYRGRMYSIDKTQPTTYDLYLETIQEGDPHGWQQGAYDEYLQYLRENETKFFQRRILTRNTAQLLNTKKEIYAEWQDMITGRVYPNPSKQGCGWCSFKEPCLSKEQGKDYLHQLSTMYVTRAERG